MRGRSNNDVVSIHSSFLPVFHYRTSNLLVGSHPSVGRQGRPPKRGNRPRVQGRLLRASRPPRGKKLKCEGCFCLLACVGALCFCLLACVGAPLLLKVLVAQVCVTLLLKLFRRALASPAPQLLYQYLCKVLVNIYRGVQSWLDRLF